MLNIFSIMVAAMFVTISSSVNSPNSNIESEENSQTTSITSPAQQTSYIYTPNTDTDWRSISNWTPGTSNSCGGSTLPCQVDLVEAGYNSIEEMLADFSDDQLSLFLAHDGVEAKN